MSSLSALRDVSEKEWTSQVVELARTLGWKRYHTYRSKHSAAGWPDEALVRERLVLLELKTETGKLRPEQRDWLRALSRAGVEVYIARPRHLDQLAKVLSVRARDDGELPTDSRGITARAARARLLLELAKELDPP